MSILLYLFLDFGSVFGATASVGHLYIAKMTREKMHSAKIKEFSLKLNNEIDKSLILRNYFGTETDEKGLNIVMDFQNLNPPDEILLPPFFNIRQINKKHILLINE